MALQNDWGIIWNSGGIMSGNWDNVGFYEKIEGCWGIVGPVENFIPTHCNTPYEHFSSYL